MTGKIEVRGDDVEELSIKVITYPAYLLSQSPPIVIPEVFNRESGFKVLKFVLTANMKVTKAKPSPPY